MKLNDIFTQDEYSKAYRFVKENGYTIKELERENEDEERRFQIVEVEVKELTYAEKRSLEYPTIQDQLDMIYWDSVNGTSLWIEKIAEIKGKYPKE
jgi:hypothetical protein